LGGRLSVGDRKPGADRQGGELIDRVAAGTPIRKLLFVEPRRHTRMPFAGVRADHRAGIELPAVDAHRAAEAAANLESGLDHGVTRQARGDRLEISDLRGGLRRAIPFLLVRSRVGGLMSVLYGIAKARNAGTAASLADCNGRPTKEMPARTRISAVFSMPSLAAIWSAVRNPMPRMSRASRYGFSEISLMASVP
jgi:hypothetical protein